MLLFLYEKYFYSTRRTRRTLDTERYPHLGIVLLILRLCGTFYGYPKEQMLFF